MIGAHLSNKRPLADARAIGAELIQIFLSNPQSWKKPLPRSDAEELASSPTPIYVHAPLSGECGGGGKQGTDTEPADPGRDLRGGNRHRSGGRGGSRRACHRGWQPREATGRWRKALTQLDTTVPVLIENTASGQFAAARRLEDIRPAVGGNRRPGCRVGARHLSRLGGRRAA